MMHVNPPRDADRTASANPNPHRRTPAAGLPSVHDAVDSMGGEHEQSFGGYVLEARLALGGMAEVFRARRVGIAGFSRAVVIKRILPGLTEDRDLIEMFIDEATLGAQLRHSNIVAIDDFGEMDGQFFLAMELVQGIDCAKLLRALAADRRALPWEVGAFILREVLAALDYAHNKNGPDGDPLRVVHRDVSPHNVLLSCAGEVKLTDFGIARARTRLHRTSARVIKGKLSYMAPEQACALPLDGRADLFSAGVSAFEWLTQQRPFTGRNEAAVVTNLLRGARPRLRALRPDVPPALEAVIDGLLEPDLPCRIARASDALERLDALTNPGAGRRLAAIVQHYHGSTEGRDAQEAFSSLLASLPAAPESPAPIVAMEASHPDPSRAGPDARTAPIETPLRASRPVHGGAERTERTSAPSPGQRPVPPPRLSSPGGRRASPFDPNAPHGDRTSQSAPAIELSEVRSPERDEEADPRPSPAPSPTPESTAAHAIVPSSTETDPARAATLQAAARPVRIQEQRTRTALRSAASMRPPSSDTREQRAPRSSSRGQGSTERPPSLWILALAGLVGFAVTAAWIFPARRGALQSARAQPLPRPAERADASRPAAPPPRADPPRAPQAPTSAPTMEAHEFNTPRPASARPSPRGPAARERDVRPPAARPASPQRAGRGATVSPARPRLPVQFADYSEAEAAEGRDAAPPSVANGRDGNRPR